MFSWKEHVRIRSDLSRNQMVEKVCQYLDEIGEPNAEGKGLIEIEARHRNSFAYEVVIEAVVDPGRQDGEFDITVNYEFKPTPGGIVLSVLFWPVGLVLFMQGSSAKNQLQREIRQALEDLEDKFA